MLTRLRVNGFKNLVDVDVRFGPFTCIAGPNAVGKSNLFDAIRFLSALASKNLMEAALSVRSQNVRTADVTSLFYRGGGRTSDSMFFEVEMIAPRQAVDDLGETAHATANFLRYTLELQYRKEPPNAAATRGPIEIIREELAHIPASEAGRHLLFDHSPTKWRSSALRIKHRTARFISTAGDGADRVIMLHQDGGSRGPAKSNPAAQWRTVLSAVNSAEHPTVFCARREMESWQLLQLEPAALREPDSVDAPFHLTANGAHLPATLYHLARHVAAHEDGRTDEQAVYCRTANRLSELIEDIESIEIDRDDKRELLTLKVAAKDGAVYPARSLSDGTLRFLALTVLEMDPFARGVVCIEEPENGIHPARIPAMLRLLQDIATDPDEPVDDANPLRQVIVNTHSPTVVSEVPDDTLLVAETEEFKSISLAGRRAVFSHLEGTWRDHADQAERRVVARGRLLTYLNPVSPRDEGMDHFYAAVGRRAVAGMAKRRPRVADREDLQPLLFRVAE